MHLRKKKNNPDSAPDSQYLMGSKLSFKVLEAYKLLRTNVIFSMPDTNKGKIIGITSALRGEGKSATALNLSYTIAMADKRVLLIEGDMRIPMLGKILNLEKTPGLSHVLEGVNQLNESISTSVLHKDLNVLPAGEVSPNSAELLLSTKMEQVVTKLSGEYEYIIIDLPPITVVSDGLSVSKLLNGMIIVVRRDYCDQYSLSETMRQMEFLNVKVLGFVMTMGSN